MKIHKVALSDSDIQVLLQMIAFGQLEIMRQMKRLSSTDFDLKEYYWKYRSCSNDLKNELIKIRGY
jgi:hypothetical protein